jgi:hypothetical protein
VGQGSSQEVWGKTGGKHGVAADRPVETMVRSAGGAAARGDRSAVCKRDEEAVVREGGKRTCRAVYLFLLLGRRH